MLKCLMHKKSVFFFLAFNMKIMYGINLDCIIIIIKLECLTCTLITYATLKISTSKIVYTTCYTDFKIYRYIILKSAIGITAQQRNVNKLS